MSRHQSGVVETNRPTTGVRSVSRPGSWVVPPWPEDAGVHVIARQFLDFQPLGRSVSGADEKAYYLGYLRALDAVPTHDLTGDLAWAWYGDLRRWVARCAARYLGDHPEKLPYRKGESRATTHPVTQRFPEPPATAV